MHAVKAENDMQMMVEADGLVVVVGSKLKVVVVKRIESRHAI